jgi:protein-disulfide isomerase
MAHKLQMTAALILFGIIGSMQAFSLEDGRLLSGSATSPIRIEVFSDFQCPACKDLYLRTIKQVMRNYSSIDKVSIIYHEFPLSTHVYSRKAARYCEAASYLGIQSLLTVFDSLFTDQSKWSRDGNIEAVLMKALPGEELLKLKRRLRDPAIDQAIEREIQLGKKREIRSTPTIFFYYEGNEKKVEGEINYNLIKQYLNSIIK